MNSKILLNFFWLVQAFRAFRVFQLVRMFEVCQDVIVQYLHILTFVLTMLKPARLILETIISVLPEVANILLLLLLVKLKFFGPEFLCGLAGLNLTNVVNRCIQCLQHFLCRYLGSPSTANGLATPPTLSHFLQRYLQYTRWLLGCVYTFCPIF